MSIVKHLPGAAIPEGGVPGWPVKDARRWLDARLPAPFAPVPTGWILLPLVLAGLILSLWNAPGTPARGTEWSGYPETVLLLALPAWYRFLPAATLVSALLIALHAAVALHGLGPDDTPGRVGGWLLLALCTWAFAGSLLRLRARRLQREIFLAAAGESRAALPHALPDGHRSRGLRLIAFGGAAVLGAGALLVWALVRDLGAGAEQPYDATGQQVLALLLLVPGTALLGRGLGARRAARRLRAGPQPVLRVGVRSRPGGRRWLVADADTTTAPPLIAFRHRFEDGYRSGPAETLLGGPESRLRAEHHDIDPYAEPYEALMYGVPHEGAEVILRYAVHRAGSTIAAELHAAPLLPYRRHGLLSWRPEGASYTLRMRAEAEKRKQRAAERSSGSGSSCGSSGGCGSSGCGSSCGSSCGGGCGGGD
ncbi:hypothetical protein [Streptomyces sp. NPDC047014]|uniref:hypothetical protein n=1 Tax=Streptomyces sp. NPDC047014 TaxID=3155736 RepID=UPI0033F51C53